MDFKDIGDSPIKNARIQKKAMLREMYGSSEAFENNNNMSRTQAIGLA